MPTLRECTNDAVAQMRSRLKTTHDSVQVIGVRRVQEHANQARTILPLCFVEAHQRTAERIRLDYRWFRLAKSGEHQTAPCLREGVSGGQIGINFRSYDADQLGPQRDRIVQGNGHALLDRSDCSLGHGDTASACDDDTAGDML
jgi:hypothetical protein